MEISLINRLERLIFSVNIHRAQPSEKVGLAINCPITLFLVVATFLVHLAYQTQFRTTVDALFSIPHTFNWSNLQDYASLFLYVLGDDGRLGNISSSLMLIVLLGPILEERLGALQVIVAVLATSFVTGVVNVLLFKGGLYGPTCLAYLFVFLASFANVKKGQLPVSFLLVLLVTVLVGADDWTRDFKQGYPMIMGSLLGWLWAQATRRVMAKE